jgi:Nitrile hydratase beta subunit.
MNGVHDMGGMHGFGKVSEEPNEPVFHADWEGRTFAMSMVMRTIGLWNIDMSRAEQEMLPAHLYLASSYYERWGRGLEQLVLKHGLASKEEMAAGHARTTGKPLGSNLKPADVTALLTRGSYERPAPARLASSPATGYARATSTRRPTHACRVTYVDTSAPSRQYAAVTCSPTRSCAAKARIRTGSTPSCSMAVTCGEKAATRA